MNKTNIKNTLQILYKAFNLLGKYKIGYLIGLILSSAKYAIKFINPVVYKFITDMIIGNLKSNDYMNFLIIILMFVVLIPIFCYGHYLRSVLCVQAQNDIQKAMFSHIVKLPIKNVYEKSSGVYLTKIADDILFVDRLFKKYAFTAFGKFIIFTGVSTVIFIKVSFKLFLINFVLSLLFLTLSLFIVPQIRYLEISAKESSTKLHSYIIDFLNNIIMIRLFGIEKFLMKKFSREVNNVTKNKIISKSIVGIWDRFVDIIKSAIQPVSIVFMVWFLSKDLGISDIIFISGITSIYAEGLCNFISFFQSIQNDLVCAKRIFDIFECEEEEYSKNCLHEKSFNKSDYIIEFKNVDFSYNQDKRVLNKFNFKVKKNQLVVIVGESGSGKSTVLKLLQKFYNDFTGEILFNGIPINEYNLDTLRNRFAYVSQDSLLFNKSIEDNVKLVKDNANSEEYWDAIKFSQLDDTISNMGIATIGRGGYKLSGGEKQKLSIARVFLKNSEVFLFDEFTSALDQNTEKKIFNNLKNVIGKKTIIMVTHRLNYIKNADCIFVIRNGKVFEKGTHEELLKNNKYYQSLYKCRY